MKSSGIEPFINSLKIISREQEQENYYLSTSPEFSLKKMLALFFSRQKGIFEIAHSFRDEKKSDLHHLEFTMAEWYKTSSYYLDFIHEINQLIYYLFKRYKTLLNKPQEKNIGFFSKYKKYSDIKKNTYTSSVSELFKTILGIPLSADKTGEDYQKMAKELGLQENKLVQYKPNSPYQENWLKSQLFQIIFDHFIMPKIKNGVWHIYDFPLFLRGMSSLNEKGWSQRVECYIEGIEISNGYQELASPEELKEIWQHNNQIRKIDNKPPHKLDELLIELIPKMAGVAGISLGIERLLIALNLNNKNYNIKNFFWPS